MDAGSYSHIAMTNMLTKTAQANGILYQFKRSGMGANDARAVQTSCEGVATVSFSVPCRYLHSPVGVVAKSDVESAVRLLIAMLEGDI